MGRPLNTKRRPSESSPDLAGAAERRPGVLLVDDTPANLLALDALITPLGANTVQASSGEEALARLADDEFALVVLDVQMPGLNGFDTLVRLRERERGTKTPVLFVTAISGEAHHVARAYALGAVDFITKPLDPAALRAKVTVFLELYEAREGVRRQAALLRARDLAASERKYRFLADTTPEIVWTETPRGEVSYVNRRFVDYSGLPAERVVGGSWAATVHPDDVARCLARRDRAVREDLPFEAECRLRRHDGAYRWFLARALPRYDVEGVTVEWVGTATDIDDRKRAEAEREALLARERAARALAEEASRAKDEFLAFVSHELRAPLNAIVGWAQLLREDGRGEAERRRALEVIETNAEVQAKLIDDLLDVGRVNAGKLALRVAPLRLDAVVRAALDMVRPAAEAKSLRLKAALDDVGEFAGDEGRLQQVVWNLLNNAVKFTPEGGFVEVSLARRGARVELRVSDTGRGIAPDFLPHVFDRFRQADAGRADASRGNTGHGDAGRSDACRADASRSDASRADAGRADASRADAKGGLGLGLSIVKSLVELHGGTVEAVSAGEGQGSLFRVLLPAQPPPPAAPPARAGSSPNLGTPPTPVRRPAPSAPRLALDGARVLVVDDDPDARYFIATTLRSSGAVVSTAESAHEAFFLFQRERPDLLVSDIDMPSEDGCSLVRSVRRLPPEAGGVTPAVALTALARPEDRTRALLAGFTMYLTKPTTAGEFVTVLSKLLERLRTGPQG